MNLGLWTWIAWATLILAPFATGGLCWHYGLAEGAHRGRCAERERQLERARRAELRAPYAGPEIRAKTGPVPRLPTGRSNYVPGDFRPPAVRDHVTAADLAPVVVPRPGTVVPMRPQRGGTGPDTLAMHRAATDTGELRKLTDEWIAGARTRGLIT